MKEALVSLINALVLIGFGSWGYFGSSAPSKTALIPVIFGVLILAMVPGVRKHNKVIAHISVLLTLLILGGLVKPLIGAVDRNDGMAILRVMIMILTTIVALFFFIKNFVDVRRARKARANEND